MFRALLVASWLLASVAVASAEPTIISVKVQRLDISKREVEFLLPMHFAVIVATYPIDCDPVVQVSEFYPAQLVAGRISTTRRNGLEVQATKKLRILFRVEVLNWTKGDTYGNGRRTSILQPRVPSGARPQRKDDNH